MAKKKSFVYFLGAGASYGVGAEATVQAGGSVRIPTQADFWSTFLRFCGSRNNRSKIESFLFRYFLGYSRVPSRSSASERRNQLNSIDVEEVFTFLSERVRAPSTSPQLRKYSLEVWEALVEEIGHVFGRFHPTQGSRRVIRQFRKNHIRSFDAVVSFNYDTVLEDSLPHSYAWAYEGIEEPLDGLPVLKPHGSINWAHREGAPIEVQDNPPKPVIVAPTHLKFVATANSATDTAGYLDQSQQVASIWARMESRMRQARALVFIGYSFPVADLYFSSVLRSVLADRDTDPDIVVVNPDAVALSDRLRKRFALRKVVPYFDFVQFAQSRRHDVIGQLEA